MRSTASANGEGDSGKHPTIGRMGPIKMDRIEGKTAIAAVAGELQCEVQGDAGPGHANRAATTTSPHRIIGGRTSVT
jgi:hypothetical protein